MRKASIEKRRNFVIDDIISYQDESGIFEQVKILQDYYIGEHAIHIMKVHVLWTSERGDVEHENIIKEKRAKFIYLNATMVEEGKKGNSRRKELHRKKVMKSKSLNIKYDKRGGRRINKYRGSM